MGAKIKTLFICLSAGLALTVPAAAQERLVMPFSCSLDGGTVSLAPAAPQTYKIYGHREEKRLTTCSPLDPRRCHDWFVYRFDLDCGGRRTSWQSVVAALSREFADAPATREDAYADPYTDPYAGARRIPPWAPGRRARAYRRDLRPAVDFPPGFAPNPMRVAIFEGASPSHIPLPPKKPVLAARSPIAETAPDFEPAAQAAPNAETDTKTDTKTEAKTEAAGTEQAEDRPAANADKAVATKSEPTEPDMQIALSSQTSEATGSVRKSVTQTSTLWRDASVVFTVTLAVLLALTALLLLRRRVTGTMPIPFAGTSLKRVTRSLFTGTSHAGPEDAEADISASALRPGLRLWDEDWLPATRNEAVEVLGVDPGAGRDTMKTTVTRLRRALHPDHALDEEDRLLRERRLKQINVAWDIVLGKRRGS